MQSDTGTDIERDTGATTTRGRTMTADARRSRGQARRGSQGAQGRGEARRGRPRVAGQRAAERRREDAPPKAAKRSLALPSLPAPRLPRLRRGPKAPPQDKPLRSLTRDAPRSSAPRATALLGVLALLAAVAVGYLAVQLRDARASESAASNGQVTAARYAEQLLSYNHARLDRDFAEAQKLVTEGFRKQYTKATDVVREKAVAERAVIKAEVVAASVVNAEPHEVRTLLFVNQTTTTKAPGSAPAIDLNRVMLTLVEEDGRWRVSDLDAL
jgi:Mce-associated membrane protein